MTRRCALALLLTIFFTPSFAQYKKYSFQQPKMGSPFNIVIYSPDSLAAANAALSTFKLIDTLNEVYSDYLPTSELNRLCASAGSGKWVKVSEALFTILQKALFAGKLSKGTFDITMSPVVRLWRTARRNKKLPSKDSIAAAKRSVGYRFIKLDTTARLVQLTKPRMRLDLGGIANGEIAQRAYNRLKELGFMYALTDAGGDVVAGDVPAAVAGWRVAVNLPGSEELMNRQLRLKNMAVTTSGDLYQYLEVNGLRYSHIIDPRTGWALTNARNVTVISSDGTSADWLTKACSILPIKKALRLIARFPGAEVQIARMENGHPRFYRSAGFEEYFTPR